MTSSRTNERSVREVLTEHLSLRERGDLEEDLSRNYHAEVAILTPRAALRGHDAVRKVAETLYKAIGDGGHFHYSAMVCDDRVALLEWSADAHDFKISDGVDSYIVENGLIVAQTIRYTVLFAEISQARVID